MNYPSFFDKIAPIELYDPLSEFLGACEEGRVEISYLDCVKLAGHSCPTVAGAYLMALVGLKALYPEGLPQRGSIKVEMRENETQGVTGVICSVISYIVGAAGSAGFKGLQGKMSRNNLVAYNVDITREIRFTRIDTGARVELDYDSSSITSPPQMQQLMGKMIQNNASDEEKIAFGKLWQERVEKILLDKENLNKLITIS